MAKASAHPGFKKVAAGIAAKEGVSQKAAGAILASATRNASPKAKAANPRLNRVKGGEGSKADKAEDKRGMKSTGMTAKQYEKSARDKKEDAARAMKTCRSCGTRGRVGQDCPHCGMPIR